jgi:hypothetical protein
MRVEPKDLGLEFHQFENLMNMVIQRFGYDKTRVFELSESDKISLSLFRASICRQMNNLLNAPEMKLGEKDV